MRTLVVLFLVLATSFLANNIGNAAEGLTAQVYNVSGQNNAPSIPNGASPILTTTVPNINFQWGGGSVLGGPAEDVIVVFTGSILSDTTQDISFMATADDGTRLYIDGVLVTSDWYDKGGGGSTSAPVSFTEGTPKTIQLMYYENGGGAAVSLYWNKSGSMGIVPASAFTSQGYTPVPPKTIGAPRNLTVLDNGSAAVLSWEAPNTGNTQPERYAISFTCSGCNGWGIATGNAGSADALKTTMNISYSLLEGLMPSGTIWTFTIRSDNDTEKLYSETSNPVTLKIGKTAAEIAAEQAAAQAAIDAENARLAAIAAEEARLKAEAEAKAAEEARLQAEAAALLAAQQEAARLAAIAEQERLAELERQRLAAIAEAARLAELERQRLEAEAAAKAEAERLAKIEAERIAAELKAKAEEEARLKAEAEAKAEAERLAKIEAERIAAEEAARIEAERLAAEAAAKAEADRLAAEAAEKAEADRLAAELKAKQEAEAKAAADLKAKQEADRIATEKAEAERLAKIAEEAKAGKELSKEEVAAVVTSLVADLKPGESISAAQVQASGVSYSDLPPSTPVEVRTDENGNALVITAEVAANIELVQDPGALLETAFSDPGAALEALGSIGADMTEEEREEATEMVVATVVAAGAAINAAAVAAGGATGGSTGGGSSGGGSGANSPGSRGGRRW